MVDPINHPSKEVPAVYAARRVEKICAVAHALGAPKNVPCNLNDGDGFAGHCGLRKRAMDGVSSHNLDKQGARAACSVLNVDRAVCM